MKLISAILLLLPLTNATAQSEYESLKADANSGNLLAKYELALMLMDGQGEHEDSARAMELLLESAELELWESLWLLGDIYKNGSFGKVDEALAYKWYLKGAKSGSKECQLEAGLALLHGIGITQNTEEGFIWVSKSATTGYDMAKLQEYRCYRDGLGIKQSGKKGLSILTELAESGNPLAQVELGHLYVRGHLVKNKDMAEAYGWYEKSALQNSAEGQYQLGLMLRSGKSPNKDHENNHLAAFLWFQKAAEQDHYVSMAYVGFYHLYGDRGIDKNTEEAIKVFNQLKKAGQPDGLFGMAICYKTGDGLEQDNEKYKELLVSAAKSGSIRAILQLGYLYESGEEFDKNLEKAFQLYLKAAQAEETDAFQKVAVMYCHGKGVEQNIEECAAWRKKAYDQKIPDMDGITTKYELEEYWK